MRPLLLAILLFSLADLNAQTKEETIDWIVGKMMKYGDPKWFQSESYNATDTSFTVIEDKVTSGADTYTVYTTKLPDIIGLDTRYKIDGKACIIVNTYGNKIRSRRTIGYDENGRGRITYRTGNERNISELTIYMQWDAEPDLYNRFATALAKLISYNKANIKKEAF